MRPSFSELKPTVIPLQDICIRISSGGTPSRKRPDYFRTDGIGHLWVKSKELLDRSISDTEEQITDEALQNSSAKYYPANTVLMAMYGANVGQLGWLRRPATVNQAICGMVVDEAIADFRYVFYALLEGRSELAAQAQGAAQQNLNQDLIRRFEIPLPPLPTQRKIAAILSAYDDLIENNTRRIAILEEMAQALYREWFVHFRFPGHQQVAMVDSELGLIPEGWGVKRLEGVCNLIVGQSPKSEFYNEEREGLPFHQGVKDFGDLFPTTRVYCTITKRVAEASDILFSVRAPVGRINVADRKMVIGRGLHAIRSKTGNQTFILLQLKDKFREEDMMGGGTIFKAVTKSGMLGIQLLMPSTDLIDKFEQIAVPMFSVLKVLTEKNVNLRRTRDLLLPRLISGEVDVSELEINTGGLDQ